MKVYYNAPTGSCGYGCILVAANSKEEAIKAWNKYKDKSDGIFFDDDNFEEFEGLSFDSEKAGIILDNWEYC